jgi:hypothetical protein
VIDGTSARVYSCLHSLGSVLDRYPLAWGTKPGTVVLPVLRANGKLDRLKKLWEEAAEQ